MKESKGIKVLGLDPGTSESGYVIWNSDKYIVSKGKVFNESLLKKIYDKPEFFDIVVIEIVKSYGMPVGQETFETCFWIGRFQEALLRMNKEVIFVGRKECIIWHNKSNKGNDATLKRVLKDKYGDKGTIKKPGVLFGVSKDIWSAVALATWYCETNNL